MFLLQVSFIAPSFIRFEIHTTKGRYTTFLLNQFLYFRVCDTEWHPEKVEKARGSHADYLPSSNPASSASCITRLISPR